MLLFSAVVLFIFWYWRVGYWEIVGIKNIAPSGYDSVVLTLLRPLRLKADTETTLWFMTQPLVLLLAWVLRAKLGAFIDKVYRAI